MAEGFELVRTIRQHLRRGAALLDEGKLDDAIAEANAALALDPQSLHAQALRDRIERSRPAATLTDASTSPAKASSFVPQGVNAASWRGFEQRITERRFRALLETVNTSIVAGDAAAARVALDEARELRPDAPELAEFEARVAAVPVAVPVAAEAGTSARVWMRAMGAAALFLVGVSMFIGLELIRPAQNTGTPVAVATPLAPAPAPADDVRFADAPQSDPIPVEDEDDSVPAIVLPPEPTMHSRGTTGATTPALPVAGPVARSETAPPPLVPRSDAPVPAALTAAARPIETRAVEEDLPVRPVGEVADDYVAQTAGGRSVPSEPVRSASNDVRTASNEVRTASNETPILDTQRSADVTRVPAAGPRLPSPSTASPSATATEAAVVPAAVVTSPVDTSRVEEVLRRYARAYDALDASAARAVWPTVNEKALARAFQDLSSQNVSFDNCDIDIRGAVANASCSGEASYVVKVGSREPKTEPRLWRFELRRDGEAWKIENAETRRQATANSSYRDR